MTKYASIKVCTYAHICKSASLQVWKYERMHISTYMQYASMQVYKYAIMQVCKYTSVLMYASLQVCNYASMQLCKYTHVYLKSYNKKKEKHRWPLEKNMKA